jgi:dynein heavy chain
MLSAGADPSSALMRFARDVEQDFMMRSISLGQGQGKMAERHVNDALNGKGSWVLLQNCHLAPSWMGDLERIVDELASRESLPDNFRLWLTSAPHSDFPVSVLRRGVKVTNEPPRGLRANLLGSYLSVTEEDFLGPDAPTLRTLHFGLCFFHAVAQERRKYDALGWNAPYEFNASDLAISAKQLRLFLALHQSGFTFSAPAAALPPPAGARAGAAANNNGGSEAVLSPPSAVPFDALRYVTCELNYGGRITDAADRRLCNTLLGDFYTPALLLDPEYSFSPSGLYRPPPPSANLEQTRQHVLQLPARDLPEVFGLHDNVDITHMSGETAELFAAALVLQPREAAAAAARTEEVAARLASELEEKLPPPFDVGAARHAFAFNFLESLNTVLVQELIRYNGLTAAVRASVAELRLALAGRVPMTDQLEELVADLNAGRVPDVWSRRGYASRKPLASWSADLLARLRYFDVWASTAQPDEFWLPAFFVPEAFLTAVLQNHARRLSKPIDMLRLEHKVLSARIKKREKPETGANVYGLYLEGAAWHSRRQVLTEAQPKQLFVEMNVLWLNPTDAPSVAASTVGAYDCPMYKTTARGVKSGAAAGQSASNFVCYVSLPSEASASHWVKRSAALICSLDD